MQARHVTGATCVAGVVGRPIAHSLSPLIHNAWLTGCAADGVYVPFSPTPERFQAFVDANRGGALAGLNVTAPFKAAALACADAADDAAQDAGSANLLLFEEDGSILVRNTDGEGLLAAFAEQAVGHDLTVGPVVVLGAGGAARGAVSALASAGAEVWIVNRTIEKAQALARAFPSVRVVPADASQKAIAAAATLINATPSSDEAVVAVEALPPTAVVMDMVYTPLVTPLLARSQARGLRTVDGLAMLIGQARPSFEALFGRKPPDTVDVRRLAVAALERST